MCVLAVHICVYLHMFVILFHFSLQKAKSTKKPVLPTPEEVVEKRLKLKNDQMKLLHKAKTIEARGAAVLATIKRNEAEVMKLDMNDNCI